MESWNNILHAALLGTDKRQLKPEDFSEPLEEVYSTTQLSDDKEIRYLNMASVVYNYRKCGVQPINKNILKNTAAAEEKLYAGIYAHQLLNDIITADSCPLFERWLNECNSKNKIVLPEYIPALFDLGIKYKQLQQQILSATGNRGLWLLPFNDAWKIQEVIIDESIWQTGSLDQRKAYLRELRLLDSAKARLQLQEIWSQENANTKTELLKQLQTGLNNEDVEWLEQLLTDKSQKVKDEVLRLLKLSPVSSIIKNYWEIIIQSIEIKKEKGLLGIGSKTVLNIHLPAAIDESIFKSGIEKIASQKNVSDDDFILYQLISSVPPSFFEHYFQLDKKTIIDLFSKSKAAKQFIGAFGLSAVKFNDADWLRAIIPVSEHQFYPEAFLLLSKEEAEQYALLFLKNDESAQAVVHYLSLYYKTDWSIALTRAIFSYTVKNQYAYNRQFYKEHILFIAPAIIKELNNYVPSEEYMKSTWIKTSEYICQLISLKTETLKAFQS